MGYIRTFENFDAQPKKYLFYVLKDTATEFNAEVRNEAGEVIYQLDKEKVEKKHLMTNKTDVTTLRTYLIKIKKLKDIDELNFAETTQTSSVSSQEPQS